MHRSLTGVRTHVTPNFQECCGRTGGISSNWYSAVGDSGYAGHHSGGSVSMKCPSEKRCSQCQEHGLPYVSTAAINGQGAVGNPPHHRGLSIASSHSPKLLNPKMSFTCPTCQKISPSASSLCRHCWNLHTPPYPLFTAEGKEYDIR